MSRFTDALYSRPAKTAAPKVAVRRPASVNSYEAHKAAAAARQAQISSGGRNIGELPDVQDPERKASCRTDFRKFCETYFPEEFYLGWSPDHLKVIERIETSVLKGGLFALAMPRGSGKTTLTETAAVWALLYGHRCFPVLIGATEEAAQELLASLKTAIETNERLHADFPEVCFPIQKLDGIGNRCAGQLYHGQRTRIRWKDNEIVLPTIPGSAASGAIVKVAGITGRVRGMKFKRPDGQNVRPDLVIIDDPQTNESANSEKQTKDRVKVLAGDILGLAGPGKKISGIMPCTVICKDDMADQILDPARYPFWNGQRMKLCYAFPDNLKLWEQYAALFAESYRIHSDNRLATAFYQEHRDAMDKGAAPAWPDRFDSDEISAIQNIMDLKIKDEAAFLAEYQNEPPADELTDTEQLTKDRILAQLNGLRKGIVPLKAAKVTMFIDVMDKFLAYVVAAFEPDFTGYILDYGTFPEQKAADFSAAKARQTLAKHYPGTGPEGYLNAGLTDLVGTYAAKEFQREDGTPCRIDRIMIDANWGDYTELVYTFCRRSQYAAILTPSHGRYIGVNAVRISQFHRKQGEKIGAEWTLKRHAKTKIRYCTFDTNHWKSLVRRRFQTAPADHGSLTIWGRDPRRHDFFAEHCTSEAFNTVEGNSRRVDLWKLKPGHTENHWLDGVVGCHVAASIEGITLPGSPDTPAAKKDRPKKKITLPPPPQEY